MSIPSPDRVFRRTLKGLPRPLAALIENVTYAIAWVTLPLSFLNTIADLRIVASTLQWLVVRAEALRPWLDAAAPIIAAIVSTWRQLTEPFHAWLSSWVPFTIPLHLVDLAIVAAFVTPSVLRVLAATRAHREASGRNFQARMYERGEVDEDGTPFEPAETTTGAGSKWRRRMALRRAQILVATASILGIVAMTLIVLDALGVG